MTEVISFRFARKQQRGLLSRIAVSDSLSSSNAISAVFVDLHAKGLIGGGS